MEKTLIAELNPVKMNIAALGTAVPHLHFRIIPRFADDATFPKPAWTSRRHSNVRYDPVSLANQLRYALGVALDGGHPDSSYTSFVEAVKRSSVDIQSAAFYSRLRIVATIPARKRKSCRMASLKLENLQVSV